jgi:mono/diheme cytochrome c family protein
MQLNKLTLIFALSGIASLLLLTYAISEPTTKPSSSEMLKRGKYLVTAGGCNDCHSPKIFTAKGPIPDSTRLLSGAPHDAKVPEIPAGVFAPDKWGALCNNDMTVWAGPWGVSFAANLTPENYTGSGSWTEEWFLAAMRNGKHLGAGRDILPPMPWPALGQLTDSDLKAIFAYIKTIKPIRNQVPNPIPPPGK